jgi:6-phosphogluconolactonase
MRKPEVLVFEDKNRLSRAAADFFVETATTVVKKTGRFTALLAGGGTPRALYELLATQPYVGRMPWSATHLFWGDERFVLPEHPESNYGMAHRALIRKVPLSPGNVHPVPTVDCPDVQSAAAAYDRVLRDCINKNDNEYKSKTGNFPRFDLVLLGMGADGHTASLFPGCEVALREDSRLAVAVKAPPGYETAERVTVTLPVITSASNVLFMVAGSEKQQALDSVLNDPVQARRKYPAAMVRPENGRLIWYLDREADVTR